MPKPKTIEKDKVPKSEQERDRQNIVKDYFIEGMKISQIALKYEKSVPSISRIISKYRAKKTTARKKGSGRSKSITKSDKTAIHNILKHHPTTSCEDLTKELNLTCCPETVRLALHSMNFTFKSPDKKLKLVTLDKVLRFHWAQFNCDCDFAPVIFIDETTIQLGFSQNKCWCQKGYSPKEQGNYPEKVNVCGAIGLFGQVMIHVYEENTDSTTFINILRDFLIPNADQLYHNLGYEWVLVMDNARYHTSNDVQKFLRQNHIETLPFPPYSPDINPIENLWALLKHNVAKREPRDLDELENFIYEEWNHIPVDTIASYVSSINRRMESTVNVEGEAIPY